MFIRQLWSVCFNEHMFIRQLWSVCFNEYMFIRQLWSIVMKLNYFPDGNKP